MVQVGLRQVERLNQEMAPLRRELARLSCHQPLVRALRRAHYGVGGLLSVAVVGRARQLRFSSSDDALRHTCLDITIYDSDGRRDRRQARDGVGSLQDRSPLLSRPAGPRRGRLTVGRLTAYDR